MTLLLSALLSEFHMVKSDAKLVNAFRYREGKNDYYLCAESEGKVLLRVSSMNIDVSYIVSLKFIMFYMASKAPSTSHTPV